MFLCIFSSSVIISLQILFYDWLCLSGLEQNKDDCFLFRLHLPLINDKCYFKKWFYDRKKLYLFFGTSYQKAFLVCLFWFTATKCQKIFPLKYVLFLVLGHKLNDSNGVWKYKKLQHNFAIKLSFVNIFTCKSIE